MTKEQLQHQLLILEGNGRLEIIRRSAAKFGVPLAYALAIGSRETNLTNINGDGGHGRSMWQIDDRYHKDFIRQHLPSTSEQHFSAYTDYAMNMIAGNVKWAKKLFPLFNPLKIAAAAYNCGRGGATIGVAIGNCDKRTTGKNYGADVLARMTIFATLLK